MNILAPFRVAFHWVWARFLRLLVPFGEWFDRQALRGRIAHRYLKGTGLEIGGLHRPMFMPAGAAVEYVDRLSNEDLAKYYEEFDARGLVNVTHVDDGTTLSTIPDASKDFVVASHIIEHTEDPIAAIKNWLRVVKTGGIIYMIVPDKRHTFDELRPITTQRHVIRDHEEGPEWSRHDHYREWAYYLEALPEDKLDERAKELAEQKHSMHFHVWTPLSFLPLLYYVFEHYPYQFSLELLQQNRGEFIIVLKKYEDKPEA